MRREGTCQGKARACLPPTRVLTSASMQCRAALSPRQQCTAVLHQCQWRIWDKTDLKRSEADVHADPILQMPRPFQVQGRHPGPHRRCCSPQPQGARVDEHADDRRYCRRRQVSRCAVRQQAAGLILNQEQGWCEKCSVKRVSRLNHFCARGFMRPRSFEHDMTSQDVASAFPAITTRVITPRLSRDPFTLYGHLWARRRQMNCDDPKSKMILYRYVARSRSRAPIRRNGKFHASLLRCLDHNCEQGGCCILQ